MPVDYYCVCGIETGGSEDTARSRETGCTTLELWALFVSSFLSATLLPGGSELIFTLLALRSVSDVALLVLVATVGNSLGGMTSWAIGRALPNSRVVSKLKERPTLGRSLACIRRHGAPVLLAAWVPVVGDSLCVAAGWFRLGWISSMIYITLGKAMRYIALAVIIE